MTRFRAILMLVAVAALAGCASAPPPPTIVHGPVKLPEVARPVLAPVAGSALQCLSRAAYTTIVERERALKGWGLAEEAVIKTNNAKAAQAEKCRAHPKAAGCGGG